MNEQKKKVIVTVLFSLLFLGTSIYFWIKPSLNKEEKVEEKTELVKKEKEEIKDIEEETLIVDIKGEVNAPGIYEVPKGTRVMDVITSAGGLTGNADTSQINLSKKVSDEMVIIVDKQGEVASNSEGIRNDARIDTSEALVSGGSNEVAVSGPISINQGTKEQLMTLPGIGEVKAQAIIDYRNSQGGFQTLEELMEVKGIGESTFNKLKENITL